MYRQTQDYIIYWKEQIEHTVITGKFFGRETGRKDFGWSGNLAGE
jgi:hypothetical protein